MTVLEASQRHTIRCPVCGRVLGEAAAEGQAVFWRLCRNCGALSRYELPAGRWTVEQPPRRARG